MKFTVVSIAYNEEKSIAETVQSVLEQDYGNLEYLVLDGNSSDNTVKIVRELADESKREVKIYSEDDFGVYNAMNRGIVRASGDYVIFMNGGDSFCNNKILSDIAKSIRQNGVAIYYGQALLLRRGRVAGINNTNHNRLLRGNMPIHQSIAAPLPLLKKYYFNEKYKIRADYDWILKCYKDRAKFINLNFSVCKFDCSGISARAKAKKLLRQETIIIRRDIYPIIGRIYEMLGM